MMKGLKKKVKINKILVKLTELQIDYDLHEWHPLTLSSPLSETFSFSDYIPSAIILILIFKTLR